MASQAVAVALLIEEIRVSELDFKLLGPCGGKLAVELDRGRAIARRHPRTDRPAHQRQRRRISEAGSFKFLRSVCLIAPRLREHPERKVQMGICGCGERRGEDKGDEADHDVRRLR